MSMSVCSEHAALAVLMMQQGVTIDEVKEEENEEEGLEGFTPLMEAAREGMVEATQLLITEGVDLNAQLETTKDTALSLACLEGHTEVVKLLVKAGADISLRAMPPFEDSGKVEGSETEEEYYDALMIAASSGHAKIVELLLDNSADIEAESAVTKETSLLLACTGGHLDVVKILLDRNANKEHRNSNDYTPLSLAAWGGFVDVIRILIDRGAEINSRTDSKLGFSPLMLSSMGGRTAAVELLLELGSDVSAQTESSKNTALTYACSHGRHEAVSLLLDKKANVEHRPKSGLTPLMEAASGGYVEVGRMLLERGADVNAAPVPGSRDTALTLAAEKGHFHFLELLLQNGAHVDAKNKRGNSALWLASDGGHLHSVQALHAAGANLDFLGHRKVSCLKAAFRKGHQTLVEWLVMHVTQFPTDSEMKSYILTISFEDKDLVMNCLSCMEVIAAARELQANEAAMNARKLLEELELESKSERIKREAAARKKEKKKKKKSQGRDIESRAPGNIEVIESSAEGSAEECDSPHDAILFTAKAKDIISNNETTTRLDLKVDCESFSACTDWQKVVRKRDKGSKTKDIDAKKQISLAHDPQESPVKKTSAAKKSPAKVTKLSTLIDHFPTPSMGVTVGKKTRRMKKNESAKVKRNDKRVNERVGSDGCESSDNLSEISKGSAVVAADEEESLSDCLSDCFATITSSSSWYPLEVLNVPRFMAPPPDLRQRPPPNPPRPVFSFPPPPSQSPRTQRTTSSPFIVPPPPLPPIVYPHSPHLVSVLVPAGMLLPFCSNASRGRWFTTSSCFEAWQLQDRYAKSSAHLAPPPSHPWSTPPGTVCTHMTKLSKPIGAERSLNKNALDSGVISKTLVPIGEERDKSFRPSLSIPLKVENQLRKLDDDFGDVAYHSPPTSLRAPSQRTARTPPMVGSSLAKFVRPIGSERFSRANEVDTSSGEDLPKTLPGFPSSLAGDTWGSRQE